MDEDGGCRRGGGHELDAAEEESGGVAAIWGRG